MEFYTSDHSNDPKEGKNYVLSCMKRGRADLFAKALTKDIRFDLEEFAVVFKYLHGFSFSSQFFLIAALNMGCVNLKKSDIEVLIREASDRQLMDMLLALKRVDRVRSYCITEGIDIDGLISRTEDEEWLVTILGTSYFMPLEDMKLVEIKAKYHIKR